MTRIAVALATAMTIGLVMGSAASADLVTYYNFNSLSIPTEGTPGTGGRPSSISGNAGAFPGTLSLTGWGGNIDDFAGSTINTLFADPAEESLSLIRSTSGNGTFITFQTSMTGFENPVLTFATRGTSTGFNTGTWAWSTDGVNFNTVAGNTATTSTTYALATVDLTGVSGLTNQSNVFFRYTLSGATSNAGNNRIDNFQINASVFAVPEPAFAGLAGLALLGVTLVRRRRLVA